MLIQSQLRIALPESKCLPTAKLCISGLVPGKVILDHSFLKEEL